MLTLNIPEEAHRRSRGCVISASQKKKVVQGRTAGSRNQTRNGQPGKESGGLRQWYRGKFESRPCSSDQLDGVRPPFCNNVSFLAAKKIQAKQEVGCSSSPSEETGWVRFHERNANARL